MFLDTFDSIPSSVLSASTDRKIPTIEIAPNKTANKELENQ